MKEITVERFQLALQAPKDRAHLYYEPLMKAMERFKIEGLFAVSALFANIVVETGRLQSVQESLYYKDADRIARIYLRHFDKNKDRRITNDEILAAQPYVRNHGALSKLLYDGYHGRGLIQLTWKENYVRAMMALDYDYVVNPDLVLQPKHAALTACWYWDWKGCSDCATFEGTVAKINPALMHLKERVTAFDHALETLA